MLSGKRWLAAVGIFVWVGLLAPAPARAAQHSTGVYVAASLFNLVYIPAKVVFAGGGAVVSGLTYVFTAGNSSAANSVWRSAVEGSYIVTPNMIEGKQPIRFVGP